MSFAFGILTAEFKKNSDSITEINGISHDSTYLGRASSHIFLWNKETQTIEIIRAVTVDTMKIKVQERDKSLFEIFLDISFKTKHATEIDIQMENR